MGIHDYTRFYIYPWRYLFKICYFPINRSHCMVSFYFLSVFQRATFEIVIHITYTGTYFRSITRSRSKADPAPPPFQFSFYTYFLYFLCSLSDFFF
jgi:hypothetical protein